VTNVDVDTLNPIGGNQATLPDGTVVKVGGNEVTVTYDSNGVPMHFQARITEQYLGITRLRSTEELNAQTTAGGDGDLGVLHDRAPDQSYDGGHAAGHQFFPDLALNNQFPQATRFNQVAYRNLEMEWSRWVRTPGASVEVEVRPFVTRNGGVDPVQSYHHGGNVVRQVPDRVTVRVNRVNPDGSYAQRSRIRFRNLESEVYPRPVAQP
jgi:hypothetical protein